MYSPSSSVYWLKTAVSWLLSGQTVEQNRKTQSLKTNTTSVHCRRTTGRNRSSSSSNSKAIEPNLYLVQLLSVYLVNSDNLTTFPTHRPPSSSVNGTFSLPWTLQGEDRQGKTTVSSFCQGKLDKQYVTTTMEYNNVQYTVAQCSPCGKHFSHNIDNI